MVVKNNLFILFQNQLVEYIHKIQSKLTPQQYDQLKEYYMTYKNSNYEEKMTILVNFINNLMEYNHIIIAKDSSIFASDDILYGSRETICLIPNIDFRPFAKIDDVAMWDSIQKMYIVATRIVSSDPEYNSQLTKNIFDSFVESMSNYKETNTYKSTEFVNSVWKKFMGKINTDKELYEFKNKCTNDISVDRLIPFVNENKSSFVKMIKHIIYMSYETFNEESENINVFDLRDDFITLLELLDGYLMNNDNKMIVKGLLNMAKNIPFFINLQNEYNQKMTIEGAHVTINKIIDGAKEFNNTQNIIEKIKTMLDSTITKVEDDGFAKSIEKYIDYVTNQIKSLLPVLQNMMDSKSSKIPKTK